MSNKANHYCIICGKGYYACNNCDNLKKLGFWKTLTDTPEHFLLYGVLQDYLNKKITKTKAKRELANFDLSELETFKPSAKNAIKEILGIEGVKQKHIEKTIIPIEPEETSESNEDNVCTKSEQSVEDFE